MKTFNTTQQATAKNSAILFSKLKYLFLCFLFIQVSCDKEDDPGPQTNNEGNNSTTGRSILIANEGNFQQNNASLSSYNMEEKTINHQIFHQANNIPLGDVAHSIASDEGSYYVVVNNSGKVEVLNKENYTISATIDGLMSPRYFLKVSDEKAYITDLLSNSISIIDLNTHQKTGEIPIGDASEALLLWNGKAFITAVNKGKLFVVDVATDEILDSLLLTAGARNLVKDQEEKLWVLCGGDFSTQSAGALYRIDPGSLEILQTFQFSSLLNYPARLSINPAGDQVYFLNGDIYQMGIQDNSLPGSPLISANSRNLYSLGIDPETGDIYTSDVKDYSQASTIYRYNQAGDLIHAFEGGIITSYFQFD